MIDQAELKRVARLHLWLDGAAWICEQLVDVVRIQRESLLSDFYAFDGDSRFSWSMCVEHGGIVSQRDSYSLAKAWAGRRVGKPIDRWESYSREELLDWPRLRVAMRARLASDPNFEIAVKALPPFPNGVFATRIREGTAQGVPSAIERGFVMYREMLDWYGMKLMGPALDKLEEKARAYERIARRVKRGIERILTATEIKKLMKRHFRRL